MPRSDVAMRQTRSSGTKASEPISTWGATGKERNLFAGFLSRSKRERMTPFSFSIYGLFLSNEGQLKTHDYCLWNVTVVKKLTLSFLCLKTHAAAQTHSQRCIFATWCGHLSNQCKEQTSGNLWSHNTMMVVNIMGSSHASRAPKDMQECQQEPTQRRHKYYIMQVRPIILSPSGNNIFY